MALPTEADGPDKRAGFALSTFPKVGPQLSLKVVVFDEADYQFAREVAARHPDLPFYLQVGNHTPESQGHAVDFSGLTDRLEWLLARAMQDGWTEATILPQLHVLLWGNKRGV